MVSKSQFGSRENMAKRHFGIHWGCGGLRGKRYAVQKEKERKKKKKEARTVQQQ